MTNPMTQGSTTTGELVAKLRAQSEVPIDNNIDYIQGADALMREAADALTTLERELEEFAEKCHEVGGMWQKEFDAHHASQAEVERLRALVERAQAVVPGYFRHWHADAKASLPVALHPQVKP